MHRAEYLKPKDKLNRYLLKMTLNKRQILQRSYLPEGVEALWVSVNYKIYKRVNLERLVNNPVSA